MRFPPLVARSASVAIVLVWAALFAPQLFLGQGFVRGDAGNLRAYAESSAEQWRVHRVREHWTPYLFLGLPTTASLADFRPQFLPDPLLDLWDGVHRLPFWPPLAIPLFVHLAGMLAAAALARELWSARPAATAIAGLAWGLMPNLVVPFTFGHDPQLMAVSLLPVTLFAVRRVVTRERPTAPALALAAVLAFEVLAQYPQIVVFLAPLTGAFAIEQALTLRRPTRLAWVAGAAAVGVGLSAASWWPAFLYNRLSVRGEGLGLGEVAQYSLAPRDLMSLVWPHAVGFGGASYWGGMRATDFPQYLGVTTVVLALAGLRRDAPGRRADGWFLAAVAAAGVILSLGTNLGAVYRVLHQHAPLWSSFRLPVNALIVTQLAVALLAARGLEAALAVTRHGHLLRSGPVHVALASGALMLVAALALSAGPGRSRYRDAIQAARPGGSSGGSEAAVRAAVPDLALRGVMAAAVPALLALSSAIPAAALPLAALLPVADLGLIDRPMASVASGDLASFARTPAPEVARRAAADPLHRAVALDPGLFFANDWIRWRARSIAGFHPAAPGMWAGLRAAGLLGSYPMMCAMAVGYVSGAVRGTSDTTRFEPLPRGAGGAPLWRVRRALPRAYAVPTVIAASGARDEMARLSDPAFDPAAYAVATEATIAGAYPGSARCEIHWREDGSDRLVLECAAPAPAFVVIADAWFPGWRATIDGREVPVARVDGMLRGVALPAGRHDLALAYEPEGWRAATRVSGIAWVLWIACAAVTAWPRRSPAASTPAPPSPSAPSRRRPGVAPAGSRRARRGS